MSLIGRTKELDRILAAVRGPRDSTLVVVGGHGAGKSALLSEIPAQSGHRIVHVSATSTESAWPFSGLTALLNSMDDPALRGITDELLRDASGAVNVPAIAARLLDNLHDRPSCRTIIIIDDADRMDAESQAVLGFLGRRLGGTDLALVVSIRQETPDGPFTGLPFLKLAPLGYDDTVRMLGCIPVPQPTTAAAHAAAAAAQGNPLAAVELFRLLLEREGDGKYAMPIPLPCPASFEATLAAVVEGLSAPARRVLELLSLSSRSDTSALERILQDEWTGVEELLAAGLVSRVGPHLRIRDQLLRGHVFAAMTPAMRTAGHLALAAASRQRDPYGHCWHWSFTAPDPQTPFRLLRHALGLIRNGEVAFAVEYVEQALALNPSDVETAARLSRVAELLAERGELAQARRYLEWARRVTRNPALVLRVTGLGFQLQFAQGDTVRPGAVLRLAKDLGHHDNACTAALLAGAALYYAERWQLGDAAEMLRCATEYGGAAPVACTAVDERAKTLIECIFGNPAGLARRPEGPGNGRAQDLVVHGRALSYAEKYDHACDAFAEVRTSPGTGHVFWRETARILAVDNEIRAGHVRSAVQLIDDLERDEPGIRYHRGMRHIFRVWRAHAVGDEAAARLHAADAQQLCGPENSALAARLAAVQGHFALLRGDLAESCAQLSRATELGLQPGNPCLLRCEADLVEVLVRLGRHREATHALQRLEGRSVGLRSPWLAAAVARSRAMLADGDQSLQLFTQALESRGLNELVLERARTLMCYAERLNAFGRLREGRDALMRAKVMFDEAGADAWSRHVDVLLLDGRVEPARSHGNPAMLVLADQERLLAKMVAKGMRNKEIAAALYVSVRTVEVRLTAIYRKLGVESRAQLTALAAGKAGTRTEPYVLPVL